MVSQTSVVFFSLLFLASSPLSAHPHLINGVPVRGDEAPWVVKIEHEKYKTVCTGSLIGLKWVLTAKHCFFDQTDRFSVFGGGSGSYKDLRALPSIKTVFTHPGFKSTETTPLLDFALVELERPVPATLGLKVISLLSAEGLSNLRGFSRIVTIYGWGFLNKERTSAPTWLRKIEPTLVTQAQFKQLKSSPFFRSFPFLHHPDELITSDPQSTTCSGDSGAGWIVDDHGEKKLTAVHSAGDCESLSLAAPVPPVRAWLKEVISNPTTTHAL
jgi:secreted trypsin-like serine protease